jgi:DNA-binding transcriptional LysR family regulator
LPSANGFGDPSWHLAQQHKLESRLQVMSPCDLIAVSQSLSAMTLGRAGQVVSVTPANMRVKVSTVNAAKLAGLAALGIWHVPQTEIEAEVADGRLIHVVPDWSLSVLRAYAVWLDGGPQRALTRRLIDFLVQERDGWVSA